MWPRLCGQEGAFLKVLARRRGPTAGCPGRARVQEDRDEALAPAWRRRGPTGGGSSAGSRAPTAPLSCPAWNQTAGKRKLQCLGSSFPVWGCTPGTGRGGAKRGDLLPPRTAVSLLRCALSRLSPCSRAAGRSEAPEWQARHVPIMAAVPGALAQCVPTSS